MATGVTVSVRKPIATTLFEVLCHINLSQRLHDQNEEGILELCRVEFTGIYKIKRNRLNKREKYSEATIDFDHNIYILWIVDTNNLLWDGNLNGKLLIVLEGIGIQVNCLTNEFEKVPICNDFKKN